MAKVLYTAEATVTGGRAEGHGRTNDGLLEVELRSPSELGGEGGGTNPEQLFAIGYAACFESALGVVARREHAEVGDMSIESRVSLLPVAGGGFGIAVALDVSLPQITDPEQAVKLVCRRTPRLPVLERDARQYRGGAEGQWQGAELKLVARPLTRCRTARLACEESTAVSQGEDGPARWSSELPLSPYECLGKRPRRTLSRAGNCSIITTWITSASKSRICLAGPALPGEASDAPY